MYAFNSEISNKNMHNVSDLFNALVEKDKELQRYSVFANPTGPSQEYIDGYSTAISKVLGVVFPLTMLEKQQEN